VEGSRRPLMMSHWRAKAEFAFHGVSRSRDGALMSAQPVGEEIWSVGRLLDWTQQFFARKKLESPRLDAELLLSHVLGCTRIQLYTHYDADVAPGDRYRFKELVRRRSNFEPVAYLVGEREFYGLKFTVNRDVLIPRPETEHLVDAALEFLKGRDSPVFADVGVGSGCIAAAIASESTGSTGIGFDVCGKALAVALANAERNRVAERLVFLESDLLASGGEQAFDLIASNPPYVSAPEWEVLSPDVKNWEPKLALVGGDDGLDLYRRLIPQAATRLKPGGRLMLEIGHRQEGEVAALLSAVSDLQLLPTIRDYGGHPRVVVAECNTE
jgi:release factor glutamine methyltransferase